MGNSPGFDFDYNRLKRFLAGARALLLLVLVPAAVYARSCGQETVLFTGKSYAAIRLDSNHVKVYSQSWTSGDVDLAYTPYDEAWLQLNGSNITSGATNSNSPGQVAETWWTGTLQSDGPGTYRDYSYHWFVPSCSGWGIYYEGYTAGTSITIARPTIIGVNNQPPVQAFWWLGSGVLSDGGSCSAGQSGACYYAQAAWTANPNGATGSPVWTVNTVPGGGSVSLNCSVCTFPTATATAPSSSCASDITVYASYGGFNSVPLTVFINQPKSLTLNPLTPQNQPNPNDVVWGVGYQSTTWWTLKDSCGGTDAGLDGNEQFGPWTDDYYLATGTHNNWALPGAGHAYSGTGAFGDVIGAHGTVTPPSEIPQAPLTTVKVMHNTPWTYLIGSPTPGAGVKVHQDTQQFYQDHGRHN